MLSGRVEFTPFDLDLLVSEVYLSIAKMRSSISLSAQDELLIRDLIDRLQRLREADQSSVNIPGDLVSDAKERKALEKALASLPEDESSFRVPLAALNCAIRLLTEMKDLKRVSDSTMLFQSLRQIADCGTPEVMTTRI